MTISLPVDLLKAAILCASTEQTRYYLNGVFLSATGHMVTTDGHRMFVAKLPTAPATDVIIPLDTVKAALKMHNKRDLQINLTDNCLLGQIAFEPVDGTFPDWRRVIPPMDGYKPGENQTPAHFNPDYIYDLGQMSRALGSKTGTAFKIHAWHNENPHGVTFAGREDCFAVIMPMSRTSDVTPWNVARAIA